jgi:hypothetical protein
MAIGIPEVFEVTIALGAMRLELGEEFLLGGWLLDDRLADPVAVREAVEMVGRVADGDERRGLGVHKRGRLGFACALEPVAGWLGAVGMCRVVVARYVEQDDGNSG